MNPALRDLLRDAFETGYARGVLARDEHELFAGMPREEIDAAVKGASAEWVSELDDADRRAA